MRAVIDFAMYVAVRQVVVIGSAVGREQTDLGRNGFAQEVPDGLAIGALDHAGDDVALALDGTDHDGFFVLRIAALFEVPVLVLAADEGFVHLDDAHELTEFLLRQPGADTVAHVVRGLVGAETHNPHDLEGANALFAGEHHVDNPEPVLEGLVGVLEDGADQDGEPIALGSASLALPVLGALQLVGASNAAARAIDHVRPPMLGQVDPAGGLVRESRLKLLDGHLVNALVFGHLPPLSILGPAYVG